MRVEELRRLAEANGVSSRFRLANGRWNRVRPETLEAVLAAMGVEPGVPATGGADPGAPATPSGAPVLVARRGREAGHLPDRLAGGGRARGWAAQLYALRSRRSWGIGDLGDLARLAGGPDRPDFVLLSPLHYAPATGDSPYYPSSRIFHNPLYLEVETVPEVEALPAPDRERLAGLGATGRALTAERLLDRVAAWRHKDEALRACWEALRLRPERLAAFERWRATAADLEEFAGFCALQRERPGDWHAWPAELRHPGSPAVTAWRAANPGEVGFHPGGFDAWWMRDLLAPGVTVGAPPDLLGPYGQDWALPAFVPGRLAEAGYEPFARTLRAGMAHAGGLRLDHVMGLFRLFWIPPGASPSEGTYVRYPADDLLGVLALESHRARALVIGEDLGTVQEGVRERLATERVLSYRLVWFERERGRRRRAARYPRLALAAVTTHDLPTAAGWLRGDDLRELAAIGVVPPDQLAARAEAQEAERAELFRLLEAEGVLEEGERSVDEVVAALYAFLARTPAMLVAATLEDAVLSSERPNVPGTTTERPNWRIPLPVLLEDLWDLPSFRRLVAATKRQ